ncbi:MAG: M56 family metallopeptidase, partial [Acidobacteria bacterium]|nr:M56 family metallopeptidase [Acidobacteriota bacterium]
KPVVAVAVSSPYTLLTPFTPLVPLAESGRNALAILPVEQPTGPAAAFPIVATSSVGLTAAGWGAILWIAGAALLIGRILIGCGILWRLRRQAQVQRGGPLFDALRQARQVFDRCPGVEVATSSSVGSPMVVGILRPVIVFPADFADKLRADELSLVLMHELGHVRRWDNLVVLLHRLIAALFFFHPAVWLCGCMLRREAEQACDDLVVCATGRPETYARGLARAALLTANSNPMTRRIPLVNAFAATESDLALRVRRSLGGGARRMGTRARVLAVVLLGPLMAVTLPSHGNEDTSQGDNPAMAEAATESDQKDGAWREALATDPDEWSEELKARLLALKPDSSIEEIAEAVRKRRLWREALAADPDEWSAELKARLLALKPDSSIEEIAEGVLKRRLWRVAMATDPDAWSEELKARLLALDPDSTIEEIAAAVRKRREGAGPDLEATVRRIRAAVVNGGLTAEEGRRKMEAVRKRTAGNAMLSDFHRGVVERVTATPPEEWSEELKVDIALAGWDLDELAGRARNARGRSSR